MLRFPLLAVVIYLFVASAPPLYAQDPLFVAASNSPVTVGMGSGQIELADINGDGHLDLLTCHSQEQMVTVQIGDGTGHFLPAPNSPIRFDYSPGDIQLGDLNNDGILDLGVRRSELDQVDLLLGDGKGDFNRVAGSPFAANSTHYTATKPSLHLLDINEDGNLDFVIANGRHNSFATLFGNGQGGFSKGPITWLGFGQSYYSIAFGDVNQDGHLDVVIAQSGSGLQQTVGRLRVKLGDGTGVFRPVSTSSLFVSAEPRVSALADVNGDQQLDIVLTHGNSNLSILLNNGSGRFAPAPTPSYSLNMAAFTVVVGDVNRDRKADLVAAMANSNSAPYTSSVAVLLGDDKGFILAPGSPFFSGLGAYNLALGDVNEDGKPDIITSSFESDGMTLLLGQ